MAMLRFRPMDKGEPMLKRIAVVAVATMTTVAIGGAAYGAPALSYQLIAAMSPTEQAGILDPLRAVASAAGTVGRAQGADVLSGIQIDAPSSTVSIYLTDLKQQAGFLAAMGRANPSIDAKYARFKQGSYTITQMKAAAENLIGQKRTDLSIESVALRADGSALEVRAYNVTQTRQALATLSDAIGSIPTVLEQASADVTNLSRTRDTPRWISGEALTWNGTPSQYWYDCTSGLPLRRNSDGRSFIVTAGHCYPDGATVYTGIQSGGRNLIGYVTMRDNLRDAIAVDTGSTGVTATYEWDGPAEGANTQHVYDVAGADWSYSGDMTCQDGFAIGIRCGLLVTNGLIYWNDPTNGIQHAGVEAHQVDNGLAGLGGDSGGLVFALVSANGGTSRQARGIVSARYNWENLRWTEAPPIMSSFGMYLAPDF
jgi:hypothetical protein